ncbi:MAG: hypothetical protein KIC66_03015 [Clostridium sp.]|uniref:hypothetical protein n=1 Tax=Clostridium sp. TaxID=1506 RepID=UPI001DCEBB01|nr:hypothetical protein [Clostridium sp.]MBS5926042.1 hypothetical protein [Clostridium sp.]MBS5985408.1 hypothetical protein [Clostridium sp.]
MNKKYKWISIISISLVLVLSFYNLKSIENATKIADEKFCEYLDNASKSLVYNKQDINDEEILTINNSVVKNLFAALEIYDSTSYKSIFGEDLKQCIVSLEVAMNDSESNTTILYRDRQKVLDSFSYVVSDVIKNEKNINHITAFLDVMKGL